MIVRHQIRLSHNLIHQLLHHRLRLFFIKRNIRVLRILDSFVRLHGADLFALLIDLQLAVDYLRFEQRLSNHFDDFVLDGGFLLHHLSF